NPNAFSCGDAGTVPAPDGSPPLPALFINDFIKAGGYDVVVTKATGSNGVFTGEGLAVVPWFHSAKVRVTFQNIGVNQSYQLTRGEIKSVWDPNSRFMLESEKTLAEGGGKGLEATLSYFEADELIEVEGVILNVFVNPNGEIVVQTNGGEQVVEREEGKTYALADGAGNGYLVDEEGKVTKTTATEALAAGERGEREYNTSASKSVRFLRTDQTKYGWDEYRAQVLDQHYQTVENGEHITWKALVTGQPETIGFEAADKGMKIDFKREGMSQTVLEPNGEWLTLTGTTAGWHEEVVAYGGARDASAPPLVLGKLNMVTYNGLHQKAVLIKVNDTALPMPIDKITPELNRIYSQAGVSWVVEETALTVNGIDKTALDDGESGLLSSYTAEMRTVIDAYFGNSAPAADTYYLFVVEGAKDKNKMGYMPRKKQAGFLFTSAIPNEYFAHTLAHELGHGAFRLEHTFSEYASLSKGATDNLMDYGTGTRLNKYQWDYIHDPVAVLGLFEEDEDAASLCTWWYQSITSNIWPSESDKVLEGKAPLFNHVHQNFDTYFTASQTDNKDITGHTGWSARKSSFTKQNNLTLIERVVNKFLKDGTPSFNLSNKGIFLSEYTIEGKTYKVALYSEQQNVSLEKTQVDDLCDLVNHEVVKIVLEDDYILLSFFKEKALQMTLQIFASEDEDAELWLKYLGILVEEPSVLDQVKAYWDGLWAKNEVGERLEDVSVAENVTFHGYSSNDKVGCFRRSLEMLESSDYITVEPFDSSVVQMTKYNSEGVLTIQKNIEEGKSVIDSHLDSGKPIIVGVDWKPGHTGNYDETTDHWIIIVARIIAGNSTCYRYFDPQTSQKEVGTSEANKLCVQSDGTIKGRYREGSDYDREYTITMVRPSKDK
ncbi:MAG: hypothetical protein ACOYXA_12605, partial [Bacteroidota bacterium]